MRFFPVSEPSMPVAAPEPGDALSAAYRNLRTSQFPVAARTEDTTLRDDWGGERQGVSRGGSGGWAGMVPGP